MNLKVVLFLLFICVINGEETVATTQSSAKYPCDNQILFGFENSNKVDTDTFQKQINFLSNHVFEKWNNFNHLALLKNGDGTYKQFGSFSSKDSVKSYIQSSTQIDSNNTACDVFGNVNLPAMFHTLFNTRIILFLNEFYLSDIEDDCILRLKTMILNGNSFLFVPLSSQFNQTVLKHYFSQAKIITWDVENKDTPDDWKEQFNEFYGCNDFKTTISSTKEPTNSYPPCNNKIVIAFDKSNGYTGEEYNRIQSFLINNVFQNWTRFDELNLVSFDDHIYSNIVPFKSTNELAAFINNENQSANESDLCIILNNIYNALYGSIDVIVVFLSKVNIADFNKKCQQSIDGHLETQLTFVLLNDKLDTDLLREHISQAQFIKLNLPDVEINWEWHFLTAYGCNKDDYNDQSTYPCNEKFIFAFDVFSNLDEQRDFLIEGVFNKHFNVFDNLALITYSNETNVKDFGTITNLNDVHNFIDNSFKQNTSRTSLCSLFKTLTTIEFHEQIEHDECSIWIKQLQNNINFINVVNLTQQVDVQYLLKHIPQSTFTSRDTTTNQPNNWNVESYGCQGFTVNVAEYPCSFEDVDNRVIFDRSHYLTPFAHRRLTRFLLNNVFIRQWNQEIHVYNYPDDNKHVGHGEADRIKLEVFIYQALQSKNAPLICATLLTVSPSDPFPANLLFFISKFDETVIQIGDNVEDELCTEAVENINKYSKITFVALTSLVNKTFLQQTFPRAAIISWEIEENEEFVNWTQTMWSSFNCTGLSPIVFPHSSTSTTALTTTSLTTTIKSSTPGLTSTTQTSTTKISTSTLITTTTPITSSKTSNSQNKSKEIILISIFIPLFIIVILLFIACFCFYRRKQHQQLVANMAENNNFNRTNKAFDDEREEDVWEIQIDYLQINFLDKLGSGAFGDVYLGKINGSAPIKSIYADSPHCQRFNNCEVAIKSLPQMQVDDYARSEFWKEIEFMKSLKFHVNLVCFLGYVSDPTNPLMILEYCANGDLLHFLKSNKQKFIDSFESQESPKTLISFAWQISSGLEYLGSLNLIHRDIAARNILLDKNNVCKVSDFGLCRNANNQLYLSSGGKLPIKWMALESLKENIFSNKTDVWSYGVLLWELYTLGNLPYSDVESVLSFLESGQRLSKPEYSTDEIYEIMIDCWQVDPSDRPTFTIICQLLTKMIETATLHYNYVDTLALIEEANQNVIEETVQIEEIEETNQIVQIEKIEEANQIVQIEEIEETNQIESNSSFVEI